MDDLRDKLLQTRGEPCLTVIVPQYRLAPERMQNPEILRKAVQKARSVAQENNVPGAIPERLDQLANQLTADYSRDGVGFYISSSVSGTVSFPFPVEERIIVDDSFVTRDLLYMQQLTEPYFVAVVGKKQIRVYSARGDMLTEIDDGRFPLTFEDEYEYTRPAPSYGHSRQEMADEKSTMVKVRTQSFFREASAHLTHVMGSTTVPLIIAGTVQSIADFRQQDIAGLICGEVVGSFDEYNFQELRSRAFQAFLGHLQKMVSERISMLQDRDVPGYTAKGVQEVWTAAHEGRGLALVVEKNFDCRGFVIEGDPQLYLNEPASAHKVIPAAVDEIIETVIQKGGAVLFADNDELVSLERIALQLRY